MRDTTIWPKRDEVTSFAILGRDNIPVLYLGGEQVWLTHAQPDPAEWLRQLARVCLEGADAVEEARAAS